MNLGQMLKNLEKLTVDNSPAILTAIGVAGTVTTAILSSKAAIASHEAYHDKEFERFTHGLDSRVMMKERVKLTWHLWILPASVGTITVTSIVMANRIGTRRAAAMATAYVLSERAYEEYKEKVVEKFGSNKERVVRDEIAQDRVTRSGDTTILVSDGQVLCFDQFTGRYFSSSMETIKKAMNDTNYQVMHDNTASLNDFYGRIGLPPTSFSEEVGWNTDKLMDILFSTTISPEGKPCLSIDFIVVPTRGYYKFT